jgi:hypothetical protein
MLLGHTPPPGAVVAILWVLAWAGTFAMLVGVASRAAVAVSFGASVALASLSFSGSDHWSHQYNVVFLAQLALLGGRCGDTLSADAWIRGLRGLPPIDLPRAYQWSLRLVQLAVALMFVGAFFHKWAHGQFTLRWALSDNLRHHLLVKYDLAGLERPALVEWIIDDVWRYRAAAVLNLISQLAPLAAIVFARRPLVRAVCGMFFVVEVIALGLVVSLWNLHWLPLAAVFVDWDRLIAFAGRLIGRAARPPPVTPAGWRPPRGPRIFVIAFVIYDVITSFVPALDQRLNTYPFSGFPMFATIRANPPFSDHQPYGVAGDGFTVDSPAPIAAWQQQWVDHTFRHLHLVTGQSKLRARLAAIKARIDQRYPELGGVTTLRHQLVLFVAPAYPAPARFERHPIAITGELASDGTLRSVFGKLTGTTLELRPNGVDTTGARLEYYADDRPFPHDLPATRSGDTFTFATPLAADPVYVVAVIGETRWLVATRRGWVWR